jgi:predicted Zn-dependent protease
LIKLKPLLLTSTILCCALALPNSISAPLNKNALPEIGAAGTSVLSIDKERLIGDAMMRQLRAQQPLLNDPVLIEYINDLGNKMVRNANDVNYSFEFFLINNAEINAFAFFGGHIGVHSGLITTADNESELAAVLAHEISHVTQRHLARRLEAQSQSLSTAGMVSAILLTLINPSVGIAALQTSIALSQQASINYTRGNEQEADRIGISLLANSGFDPHGAPSFFAKMAEKYRYASKLPAMLLTHPLPESRIADARGRAQNYPAHPLAPSLSFELTKARIIARYQNKPKFNIATFENDIKKQRYNVKEAAQYGLTLSYFENKEYQKALDTLLPLYQNDEQNLFYIDALSDIYIALKRFDDVMPILQQLHLIMPNNQVVLLNYANVLNQAGKLTQAEILLKDFLIAQPGNFIAYDLLSDIYKQQNNISSMHTAQAELYALHGGYKRAIDELQTAYRLAKPLTKKRIKARILQFQTQEEKLQRINI